MVTAVASGPKQPNAIQESGDCMFGTPAIVLSEIFGAILGVLCSSS
jgi:hypothetical protein